MKIKILILVITACCIAPFTAVQPAHSETFYPETTAEILTAFDTAEHNYEDDIIYIQPGHYGLTETLTYAPVAGYARYSLTIAGVSGTSGYPRLDGNSQYGIMRIDTLTSSNDYGEKIIIRDLIFQNAGEMNYGAGLFFSCYDSEVTITNCYFYNNHCNYNGGAIFGNSLSTVNINNCIFYDNEASGQGGDSRGGGLYMRLYGDPGNFLNNTFYNNSSEGLGNQAAFLLSGSMANVYNNIFWPGDVYAYQYSEGTFNFQYNDYEDTDFRGMGTMNVSNNISADPTLDTSYSPIFGSPCIDAGASFHGMPHLDFYGSVRPNPNTGLVDIGAVEFYGDIPTATPTETTAPTATPTPASGIGVAIDLPSWVSPGEDFFVHGTIFNSGPALSDIPAVFILDVLGSYWFWPCWEPMNSSADPPFCFETRNIPVGDILIEILPLFEWPDTGSDTLSGIYFYGALMTPDLSDIMGSWDAVEFGFGP